MRAMTNGVGLFLGMMLAGAPLAAQASSPPVKQPKPASHVIQVAASNRSVLHTASSHAAASHRQHYVSAGISCVPFVRHETNMEIGGNANMWWENAAGIYARGQAPETGSVLSFRSNPRMRLGHVAVVSRVMNSREIEVDHANWGGPGQGRGNISRGVRVVDVSEANDWTAVRVELGRGEDFGSVYPTYGFIYNRSANAGSVMAQAANPATALPPMSPPSVDLRPAAERRPMPMNINYDEVAEAPLNAPLTFDAPNRNLR